MFRKSDQHLQWSLFSGVDSLPEKQQARLEASWAGTFYHELFCRIDVEPIAVLYSDDEASRPNVPANLLVGFGTLKPVMAGATRKPSIAFASTQVRYAVGHRDLSEGHFDLRTVPNFRYRVAKHVQESGENLINQAFEQVADEHVPALNLKTNKLRMDSTLIASNTRQTTRLQLLLEVLQRVHRMLDEDEQQRYTDGFAAYLKGSPGQYIHSIKKEAYAEHLQRVGELMHKLAAKL